MTGDGEYEPDELWWEVLINGFLRDIYWLVSPDHCYYPPLILFTEILMLCQLSDCNNTWSPRHWSPMLTLLRSQWSWVCSGTWSRAVLMEWSLSWTRATFPTLLGRRWSACRYYKDCIVQLFQVTGSVHITTQKDDVKVAKIILEVSGTLSTCVTQYVKRKKSKKKETFTNVRSFVEWVWKWMHQSFL